MLCKSSKDISEEEIRDIYNKYYKDEKFVRVLDKGVVPETRFTKGSNYVDVNFFIEKRTNRLIMIGTLDNIVKGAAGQAVQNMNILFGLKEDTGLNPCSFYCLIHRLFYKYQLVVEYLKNVNYIKKIILDFYHRGD